MSEINEYQIGGLHYINENPDFQLWDWITLNNVPYIEGIAIKYVYRWQRKGEGFSDLSKAKHCCHKIAVQIGEGKTNQATLVDEPENLNFLKNNGVPEGSFEHAIITKLVTWRTVTDIEICIKLLDELTENR